ncbi:LPP20 family lipoprotein [Desulfoluna spongiiphila]|uniref:LPP20 family lipoprotein n=1 Tax=Desulfoluna spongiiphila TaxID=419481 RepID=UPI0012581CDC|nr:LPP20 family lipoprotein [Desulfoluna spongiiphila]VVS90614.1 prokaryotic membrane lipoprotein lipid attachment site profile [Desulfoluna spongiiphila]
MKTELKIAGLFMAALLFAGCMGAKPVAEKGAIDNMAPAEAAAERAHLKAMRAEAKGFIAEKRRDKNLYIGEGTANIGADLGKGKLEAKNRAREELARQIRVKVESDFQLITEKRGVGASAEVQQEITQRLETYTSQVLTNVQESDFFIDYPKTGTVTVLVFIPKEAYEVQVKEDLNQKKEMVVEAVKQAEKALKNGEYVRALKQFLEAGTMQRAFFGRVPVYAEIDGDGLRDELSNHVTFRVEGITSRIQLSLLNDTFLYDPEGHLEKQPRVLARYLDGTGTSVPVTSLPLVASFAEGQGRVAPCVTGVYGQAELAVSAVDPSLKTAVLQVAPDFTSLGDFSAYDLPPMRPLKVDLLRKRAVALLVCCKNGGKGINVSGLTDAVTSLLLNRQLTVVPVDNGQTVASVSGDSLNADYLLAVEVVPSGGGTVGSYANMHAARCGAGLSLYTLPAKSLTKKENLASQEGFGITAESAVWDAFGKSREPIVKAAGKMMERVQ